MSEIAFRRATPSDAPTIASLVHAAFEEYRGVLVPPSSAHLESAETIAARIDHGGAFIGSVDNQDIACIVFYPEAGDLYFGRLSVLPSHRGTGLARKLVAMVEEEARTLGFKSTRLGVRLALPGNCALFEALGYGVTALEHHEGFADPTFATMQKALPPRR